MRKRNITLGHFDCGIKRDQLCEWAIKWDICAPGLSCHFKWPLSANVGIGGCVCVPATTENLWSKPIFYTECQPRDKPGYVRNERKYPTSYEAKTLDFSAPCGPITGFQTQGSQVPILQHATYRNHEGHAEPIEIVFGAPRFLRNRCIMSRSLELINPTKSEPAALLGGDSKVVPRGRRRQRFPSVHSLGI